MPGSARPLPFVKFRPRRPLYLSHPSILSLSISSRAILNSPVPFLLEPWSRAPPREPRRGQRPADRLSLSYSFLEFPMSHLKLIPFPICSRLLETASPSSIPSVAAGLRPAPYSSNFQHARVASDGRRPPLLPPSAGGAPRKSPYLPTSSSRFHLRRTKADTAASSGRHRPVSTWPHRLPASPIGG
jgi:hypothetical protein